MGLNQDFSEFAGKLGSIIENGRNEATAPIDSLERMQFSAIRQGRVDDAMDIKNFLEIMSKELNFFREATKIEAEGRRSSLRTLQNWLKPKITPSTVEKLSNDLSPSKPFGFFEGVLIPPENKTIGHIVCSPFFGVVAANFSEAVDLLSGNIVCFFNRAASDSQGKIELRVWGMNEFAENFKGESFEQATLIVPPESNETIVTLHKGPLENLFKIAAENMVRASLGKNPPPKIAEEFMLLLNKYGEDIRNSPKP